MKGTAARWYRCRVERVKSELEKGSSSRRFSSNIDAGLFSVGSSKSAEAGDRDHEREFADDPKQAVVRYEFPEQLGTKPKSKTPMNRKTRKVI